jgi:hypothetical protein
MDDHRDLARADRDDRERTVKLLADRLSKEHLEALLNYARFIKAPTTAANSNVPRSQRKSRSGKNMTITTEELHSYDRPLGRKAGDLVVNFEVDGTYHSATFPFRVDVDKGQFIVVDGDVQYIGETKAELVDHMKKIAAGKIALTWTRYIEIDYKVGVAEGPRRRSHSGLGPDDKREGPITSISLDFDVVEYSNKFETSGFAGGNIMRRTIGDDGEPHSEERRWEIPKDVIPFSQARLDALRHIEAAMTAIDGRMRELFAGKAKTVAARLDTITNQQLALPAPVTPEVNSKAVRKGGRR